VQIEHPLHVLAGDYQGDGLLPWLGDCLSEVFYGGQTDLVVNTPSMSGGAARVPAHSPESPCAGRRSPTSATSQRDESALRAAGGAARATIAQFEPLARPVHAPRSAAAA
jgi:hypothetical protein